MKSTLKTEQFESKALGRKIKITQASALAASQFTEARGDGMPSLLVMALTCQLCIPEWKDEAPEDIASALTADALIELTEAILELSGLHESKNSEADQAGDLSSASVSH